jgi:hypothetical protein
MAREGYARADHVENNVCWGLGEGEGGSRDGRVDTVDV